MSHATRSKLTRLVIAVAMTSALVLPAFIGPEPDDNVQSASLSKAANPEYGGGASQTFNTPGGHLEDSWSGQSSDLFSPVRSR